MDNSSTIRRTVASRSLQIGLVLAAVASTFTLPTPPAHALPVFAQPPEQRNLQIHGPLILGPDGVSQLTQVNVIPSLPGDDQSPPVFCVSCSPPSPSETGTLPQSPPANPKLLADPSIGSLDPGIAVSDSYVAVSSNVAVGFYYKSGDLLTPKTQYAFPNPFTTQSLFSPLFDDIEANTNYPADVPPDFDPSFGKVADARVLFDPFRKRFFIAAVVQNNYMVDFIFKACPPQETFCTGDALAKLYTVMDYPGLWIVWRQKVVVAVSKTQDPRDGFYLYWWDAAINDGACLDIKGCPNEPVFKPGTANVDYPMFGISDKMFLASVPAGFVETDPEKVDESHFRLWWNCFRNQPGYPQCQKQLYTHLMTVPAHRLANPCLQSPCRRGPPSYSFGVFSEDNSQNDFPSKRIRPAMQHSSAPDGAVFFTKPFAAPQCADDQLIDLCGNSYIVVFTVTFDPDGPTFSSKLVRVGGFKYNSYLGLGGNAAFRDGRLYAAWDERQGDPFHIQVHIVRLNPFAPDPPNEPSFMDRSFGVRNVFDDKPSAPVRNYFYPAIEVNTLGDMAIVYARYAADLPQEVRFTVRYANDPDVRPSRLLQAGKGLDTTGVDTAGIAVDPVFDDAIWMAHTYASAKSKWRIAYGKVFGALYPDNYPSQLAFKRDTASPGDAFHVSGTVGNGGDGTSGPATVTVYLSPDPEITTADTPVGQVSIERISSGGSRPINPKIRIPTNLLSGDYFVGALVQPQDPRDQEYSTENNVSPLLESDPRLRVQGGPCRDCTPTIGVSPSSMTFATPELGADPPSQALTIGNSGGGTLTFSASGDQSWLQVSPTSGVAPTTRSVSVHVADLPAGTYNGTITVIASGATNSPVLIPVTLTIEPR